MLKFVHIVLVEDSAVADLGGRIGAPLESWDQPPHRILDPLPLRAEFFQRPQDFMRKVTLQLFITNNSGESRIFLKGGRQLLRWT